MLVTTPSVRVAKNVAVPVPERVTVGAEAYKPPLVIVQPVTAVPVKIGATTAVCYRISRKSAELIK
jgi:hypothetical protein